MDRPRGHVPLQILALGLIFVVIALLSESIWCLAASGARTWFRRLALVGGTGGLAIIGLGLGVAINGRKD